MKFSHIIGIKFSDWLKLLQSNKIDLHPSFLGRALFLTFNSLINSYYASLEKICFRKDIEEVDIPLSPFFIIGHWRSGTSHLQNLLAQDSRFGTPTLHQVFFPHAFLSSESLAMKFVEPFLPRTRKFDNVHLSLQAPEEDEFALNILSSCSLYMGMVFPGSGDRFRKYLTLKGLSSQEKDKWSESLLWFVKKLAYKYRRPLLLRSPPHTAKIGILLRLFPEAKFIHIYRNPYRVFQSYRHLFRQLYEHSAYFQHADPRLFDDHILDNYTEMYDSFFEDRLLLTENNYCEIRYEDLEFSPEDQIETLYLKLKMPDFEEFRPQLKKYLDSLKGYKKNVHRELEPVDKAKVAEAWRRNFMVWDYPI